MGAALTAQTTAELGRTRSERPVRRWARSRAVRGTTAVVGVIGVVFVMAMVSVPGSGLFGGVAGGVLGWRFRSWRAQPARDE